MINPPNFGRTNLYIDLIYTASLVTLVAFNYAILNKVVVSNFYKKSCGWATVL